MCCIWEQYSVNCYNSSKHQVVCASTFKTYSSHEVSLKSDRKLLRIRGDKNGRDRQTEGRTKRRLYAPTTFFGEHIKVIAQAGQSLYFVNQSETLGLYIAKSQNIYFATIALKNLYVFHGNSES